MKAHVVVVLAGIGLALASVPASAHHSFAAEYDAGKPVTLKGVVTKVVWTNPHSHCYVDARDDRGGVTNWNVELASPKVLVQYGWNASSLRVGDEIVVEGAMSKDGTNTANARVVMLADGRRVSAGSSGGDVPR